MKIEMWPIDRPKDYPKNARKWSARAIETVAASIKAYGWRQPVVVDSEEVIAIGHLRRAAGKWAGLTECPVHVASDLTPEQIRGLRLADNRTSEESAWDLDLLRVEMGELKVAGFDLSLTGFTTREVDGFTLAANPAEDEVPPVPDNPVTRTGDLWLLGPHRVLCGDALGCTLFESIRSAVLLTDPPYGIALDTDFSTIKGSLRSIGRANGTRGNKYERVVGDDQPYDPVPVMGIFAAVKEQFWFGADYYAERLAAKNAGSWLVWDKRKESQAEAIGSEFELIWSRQRHKRRMLRHDWFGFLSSGDAAEARAREHPTQKPTSLLRDIITQWGGTAGVIADPYLGSGSTLVAAEVLQRACYGVEIQPCYVDVTVTRWQNLTGKQATLEGDGRSFAQIQAERCAIALPSEEHGRETEVPTDAGGSGHRKGNGGGGHSSGSDRKVSRRVRHRPEDAAQALPPGA